MYCEDNEPDNCIPEYYLCDGDTECKDGSDEKPEFCRSTQYSSLNTFF